MKHVFNLRAVLLLTASAFILSSCEKDEELQPSIVDVVVSNPSFSILKEAVVKADLVTSLSQPNLTVFAPDNDAFAASGISSATIAGLTKDQITQILNNHVIAPKLNAADIPNGTTEVTGFNGLPLFVNKGTGGVTINTIKVKSPDVQARNGVIHVVEKVIMPATGNVAQIAIGSPVHKRLVQAVVKCNLVGALSNPNSRLTVFAPTDAAFGAIGFDSTAIANTPAATLTPILLYHVLGSTVLSYDITEGLSVQTLKQSPGNTTISFSLSGGAKVRGAGNPAGQFANIAPANLIATNGAVHVIDKVLLP